MTRPKHPPRRLGFSGANEVHDRTQEDVRDHARSIWLQTVARLAPAVLETLSAVRAANVADDGHARMHADAHWNVKPAQRVTNGTSAVDRARRTVECREHASPVHFTSRPR